MISRVENNAGDRVFAGRDTSTIRNPPIQPTRMMFILALLFTFSGCSTDTTEDSISSAPLPKGTRVLAIQANMGGEGDYDALFDEALAAGHEAQSYAFDWDEIETSANRFEPAVNYLAIANLYLTQKKVPLHLTLRPIHTNQKVVPEDLMVLPIDDANVIERFKKLLDWVATQLTTVEVASVVIGSEVDAFNRNDPERWERWNRFYAAAAQHAKQVFSEASVTSEMTFASFSGQDLAYLQDMHRHSDLVGVSYYPLQGPGARIQPPDDVYADFKTIVDAIEALPIAFYQIGYPSSELIGGSEALQAEFISHTFRAWDRYADRIHLLNFQWMHETTPAGVDGYVDYYQYDTEEFRAFLGSIGLQSFMGEPKPAWWRLSEEARARGFGL